MLVVLALVALLSQQTTPTPPPPPQPNYAVYGSLSRQRIVYNNLAQQDAERQLREYRRFREEVNRLTPPAPAYTAEYSGRRTRIVGYDNRACHNHDRYPLSSIRGCRR